MRRVSLPIYSFDYLVGNSTFQVGMIDRKLEMGVEELGSEPDHQPLVGLSCQSLTSNPD